MFCLASSYFILLCSIFQPLIAQIVILYEERGGYVKPLKEKVSITLDVDVIKQIKELAENDDRSFSQYVNLILKDYLKRSQK